MCGIVGYNGPSNASQIIMDGLRKLEYRGYDSAGIAVVQDGQIAVRRDVGKLSNLATRLAESPVAGEIGIGHTRWPPTVLSEPTRTAHGRLGHVVVQNGIVENFRELRAELEAEGIAFTSDTDTEVIAHLIGLHYAEGKGLAEAVRRALLQLRGPSAVVAMARQEPEALVAARLGNAGGVAVGYGDGDVHRFRHACHPRPHPAHRSGEPPDGCGAPRRRRIFHAGTASRCSLISILHPRSRHAAKGEYKHFMQKEIYEQANSH
jgi:glucosamine--fructose-6-phosphate aminotransferase (isomerizing)